MLTPSVGRLKPSCWASRSPGARPARYPPMRGGCAGAWQV